MSNFSAPHRQYSARSVLQQPHAQQRPGIARIQQPTHSPPPRMIQQQQQLLMQPGQRVAPATVVPSLPHRPSSVPPPHSGQSMIAHAVSLKQEDDLDAALLELELPQFSQPPQSQLQLKPKPITPTKRKTPEFEESKMLPSSNAPSTTVHQQHRQQLRLQQQPPQQLQQQPHQSSPPYQHPKVSPYFQPQALAEAQHRQPAPTVQSHQQHPAAIQIQPQQQASHYQQPQRQQPEPHQPPMTLGRTPYQQSYQQRQPTQLPQQQSLHHSPVHWQLQQQASSQQQSGYVEHPQMPPQQSDHTPSHLRSVTSVPAPVAPAPAAPPSMPVLSAAPVIPPDDQLLKTLLQVRREAADLKRALRAKEQALVAKESELKCKEGEILFVREKLERAEHDSVAALNQASNHSAAEQLKVENAKKQIVIEQLTAQLEAQQLTSKKMKIQATLPTSSMPQTQPVSTPLPSQAKSAAKADGPSASVMDSSFLRVAVLPFNASSLVALECLRSISMVDGQLLGLESAIRSLGVSMETKSTHMSAALSWHSEELLRCCQLVLGDCLPPSALLEPLSQTLQQARKMICGEPSVDKLTNTASMVANLAHALIALILHDPPSRDSVFRAPASQQPVFPSSYRTHPAFAALPGTSRILMRSSSVSAPLTDTERAAIEKKLLRMRERRDEQFDSEWSLSIAVIAQRLVSVSGGAEALEPCMRLMLAATHGFASSRSIRTIRTTFPDEALWAVFVHSDTWPVHLRMLALELLRVRAGSEASEETLDRFLFGLHREKETRFAHLVAQLASDRPVRASLAQLLSTVVRKRTKMIETKHASDIARQLEEAVMEESLQRMAPTEPGSTLNRDFRVQPASQPVQAANASEMLGAGLIPCLQLCVAFLDCTLPALLEPPALYSLLACLTSVHRLAGKNIAVTALTSALLNDTRWPAMQSAVNQ